MYVSLSINTEFFQWTTETPQQVMLALHNMLGTDVSLTCNSMEQRPT